ncbi:MAG: hypothetical protein NC936_05720, partial [Candidatus Omnitrophica bacterium]|nr:hypothetical protein [Candidatus Omnitrophota bacterium]
IEKLGCAVEVYDIQRIKNLQEHPHIFKLFRTFGPQAIPVVTVAEEVACMGQSDIDETISAIKSKL